MEIILQKEKEILALGKNKIIQFPNSETIWIVLDVFNTEGTIKYIVVNENLYYSVITLNTITGEYSNPEEVVDLMFILGQIRNSLDNN